MLVSRLTDPRAVPFPVMYLGAPHLASGVTAEKQGSLSARAPLWRDGVRYFFRLFSCCASRAPLKSVEPHAGQGNTSSGTLALSSPTASCRMLAVMTPTPQRHRAVISSAVCFLGVMTRAKTERLRAEASSQTVSGVPWRCPSTRSHGRARRPPRPTIGRTRWS